MVAIIDFGSQYTHLISRRIRECGVKTEIFPPSVSMVTLESHKPQGIIFSGGPASVYERSAPEISKEVLKLGVPILGICYGHQLLAKMLGGKVKRGKRAEYGREFLKISRRGLLFAGLGTTQAVWFSHGDEVTRLPKGFVRLGGTSGSVFGAFADEKRKFYGIQFHPEVLHTLRGQEIIKNFLFRICRAKKDWAPAHLLPGLLHSLRIQMVAGKAIIAVSGGVDSTVAALIVKKALGPSRILPVFLETGLLRKSEAAEVMRKYRSLGFSNVYQVNAGPEFLRVLKGVRDPEEKRKRIAKLYFALFERYVRKLKRQHKDIRYLVQGTIYPDRIESAQSSKQAVKIKSHHNVSVPKRYGLAIVEPLGEFYKDEVREVGQAAGCPPEILGRHPFPGPGLAVRVIGEVTPQKVRMLQEADAIFIKHLKTTGLYRKIWQAFAALLDSKAVGVMGDARRYGNIIALRAVTSRDGMTADWAKIPSEILERIASEIINSVPGVTRVVYDVTQKPPATIEFE